MASRLLLALLLSLGLLAVTPGTACACSCAMLPPAEQVKESTAVFTGTAVAALRMEGDPMGPEPPILYTFRVDRVYKGPVSAEVTVASSSISSACGYTFENGSRYLVYARAGGDVVGAPPDADIALRTGLCHGNRNIRPGTGPLRVADDLTAGERLTAEHLAALGPGRKPAAGTPTTRPSDTPSSAPSSHTPSGTPPSAGPLPPATPSAGTPSPAATASPWLYAGAAVAASGLAFAAWRRTRRRPER
ncbi:hypothetical protein [Sphaerisporangium sp. TRM90804]|uniref:hypothetical protein n=1 Tax=Sphaerisporangium sp. TRM90804 TaxID=3031113 RepID=UPI002449FBE6|nr:hypothetical protein [Sphaerisporangium sp. TRM90804]MDH2430705.1 hypothetical protein [Sphaerisporangium sp. TRM90804]